MNDCLFCKIIKNELNAEKVFEDEDCIAIKDINPQAPVHILIIPKKHISKLYEADDEKLLGKMLKVCSDIARKLEIIENGYRVVINTNKWAGQSVDHLHFHLLGGRIMKWPPG